MELKDYQEKALDRFERWLDALGQEREKSMDIAPKLQEAGADGALIKEATNYPKHAWKRLGAGGEYVSRFDGGDRPIPHVCFKVPTGGGKTLMSAAALERLGMRAGLVLWVVPTKKIYEQAKKALSKRDGPIRQRVDHASRNRTAFMEKDHALKSLDVGERLCVMVLSLAAVNRTRQKEFLLMNRDSGAYGSFFPDDDDVPGNARLLEEHRGLECHENGVVKRSLANVFRMLRPVVVLDEAHKAYRSGGEEYVGMINRLNPRLVLEMSATPNPDISNLLVDVSGTDLWSEEMIKMPINLNVQAKPDWKHLLDEAHAARESLESDAKSLQAKTDRYVRPIVVARVERTGKNQRGAGYIHADDVRDHLVKRLGVPPGHIAVQSSERKDLEGVDLLAESTPIRWIITKDALKEGWDCPFAYTLAILDNIRTPTSVTQLIGRVLRQPNARRTGMDSLDQCYVYCHNEDTGKVAEYVKKGLSKIGMGDMNWTVKPNATKTTSAIAKRQRRPGKIFLPLVLHRDNKSWRELNYERHILSCVKFAEIDAPNPSGFDANPQSWKRLAILPDYNVSDVSREEVRMGRKATLADFAFRLSDIVPNAWQAARISKKFMETLHKSEKSATDIHDGIPYLAKLLRDHVAARVSQQAKRIFADKIENGEIKFNLEMEDGNYLIKNYSESEGSLFTVDGRPAQRTLFDPVYDEEFDTDLERSFAQYLDAKSTIDWWHRVAASQRGGYSLAGWKKFRFYPDFIVMTNGANDMVRLGIYDTKGQHLKDGLDAEYKSSLLAVLEDTFNYGTVKVHGGRLRGEFRLVFEGGFEEILAEDNKTAG